MLKTISPSAWVHYTTYSLLIKDPNSFLHTSGWIKSIRQGYPCREDGSPMPWMNYPIITFLEQRLKNDLALFEYGSGYSTLFYAKRVKTVTSLEYDKIWYEKIKQKIPNNVELIFREKDLDGDYCRTINLSETPYDVVIVDGRDRVNCIMQSIDKLSDRGVILLDDSQREKYNKGILYGQTKGFLTLDFEGLKPTASGIDRTTVFYRRNNCLGL